LPTAEEFHILCYNNSGNNSQRSTNAAEIVRGMGTKRVKSRRAKRESFQEAERHNSKERFREKPKSKDIRKKQNR
jgi:hypothetical protein